ncbi:hypothetical protein EVAR_55144_1 [Eumeta japonica]|uniref:Uncharacterized protein n=1 Tax=Eumeta variegata TaxID=151549 RepID=A0A4C1Y772_EUMVA|nr:hypothetical protein EVAR_55144_1 [Eumeta japonica]
MSHVWDENTRTLFVPSGEISASPMTPDRCLRVRAAHPVGVRSDVFGEAERFRQLFVSSYNRTQRVDCGHFGVSIQGDQTIAEPAGDQEELSVSTSTSSSIVTAVSGSGGEVVGRRSVQTGETRRWKTSTARKNYDDNSLAGVMLRYFLTSIPGRTVTGASTWRP